MNSKQKTFTDQYNPEFFKGFYPTNLNNHFKLSTKLHEANDPNNIQNTINIIPQNHKALIYGGYITLINKFFEFGNVLGYSLFQENKNQGENRFMLALIYENQQDAFNAIKTMNQLSFQNFGWLNITKLIHVDHKFYFKVYVDNIPMSWNQRKLVTSLGIETDIISVRLKTNNTGTGKFAVLNFWSRRRGKEVIEMFDNVLINDSVVLRLTDIKPDQTMQKNLQE